MLIIGLGNPGLKYKNTYHNLGYMVIDELAKLVDKKIMRLECSSLTTTIKINDQKIILAKPTTYMNLSGQAVKSLMVKYNQSKQDLIIIYDDIDIPRFNVRVRENGSGGTHNGMKNIINVIATEEFKRIRMGIGQSEYRLKDYVLSKVRLADKKPFAVSIKQTAKLLYGYLHDNDFDKVVREGNLIGK